MGLFGIFKKKQKSQEISLTKLEEWVNSKTKEKFEILNASVKEVLDQIEETLQNIQTSMTVLQNAEIIDADKIQPKVKSIVLGHRQNYIRKLNQLISAITQPTEVNHHTALEFYEQTQQELNNFSQETTKTFYAVQHLFHKQVDEIAKFIKLLDKHAEKIKKLIEKSSAVEIDKIKDQVNNLKKQIEIKSQLKNELESHKSRFENAKQTMEQAKQKLDNLLQSSEFLEMEKLQQEFSQIKKDIREIKTQIAQIFSPLEKALRKFSKITLQDEQLVQLYSEKPAQALLKDTGLKIIPLLQNMKSSILSNSIELKDKKREKTLETIEQMTKEYLNLIITNHRELEEKQDLIEKKLKANKQLQNKQELEYKLEHATWIITKLEENIQETEENHEKINLNQLKTELEKQIKNIMRTEVRVFI